MRLEGRIFLDVGEAALDCAAAHALILSEDGLRRIALPRGSALDGGVRPMLVERDLCDGRRIAMQFFIFNA